MEPNFNCTKYLNFSRRQRFKYKLDDFSSRGENNSNDIPLFIHEQAIIN